MPIAMKKLHFLIVFILAGLLPQPAAAAPNLHHGLTVEIVPGSHKIIATDTVTLPENFPRRFTFALHAGLKPRSATPGARLELLGSQGDFIPREIFQVTLAPGQQTLVLRYEGEIHHPLEEYGKEYARGFRQTPGTISEEGVYLSASSFWYPHFDTPWLSFDLELRLPAEWEAVSQGERSLHRRTPAQTLVNWASNTPQEEIYLIAARFTEYAREADGFTAMVFLRSPDEKLAERYLQATLQYVKMYEELIGPYPYSKFALVENFWETGFGMPSFTLLGPKVIRFPFILHSSYPHEILHNWWGNSVYPDYARGNWAEGLTAYLADHLIKEQQGQDAEHRQIVLQKYADYVGSEKDFPLTAFTSRHGSVSEAVGYGKALMVFHMLRQRLGDKIFNQGLRQFYAANKFSYAAWDDLRLSFEQVSGLELQSFLAQWISQTGAPRLRIDGATTNQEAGRYTLSLRLAQEQAGEPYSLQVPLAITLENDEAARQFTVELTGKTGEFTIRTSGRPVRVDVDPEFDLFRRLHRKEIPPALSLAFGARKALVILPSGAEPAMLDAYRNLAGSWSRSGPEQVDIRLDSEIEALPEDRAVVLFGWENRFRQLVTDSLAGYDLEIMEEEVRIGETRIPRKDHSLVLTGLHPAAEDLPLTWVATEVAAAVPGLGRKLPHYHKYSYLAFEGEEPANVAKGRWPVLDSPLTFILPDAQGKKALVPMGKLARRQPLIGLPPVFSKEAMLETLQFLAAEELEGRGYGSPGLDKAADYIAARFREAGLLPGGNGPDRYFQEWRGRISETEPETILKNVIGFLPARNRELARESLVVAAHYDHLGLDLQRSEIYPGADDNASGVAVLIELARVLSGSLAPERNLVFVAFTGEEVGKLGSLHYVATQERFPVSRTIAMLNLDTVGRLGKGKLLVIGGSSAREWVHIFQGAGYVTGVEMALVNEDLDSSDQTSFHTAGVPAVQLFTGPHLDYHRPTDTPDKIDADGLLKVAAVAREAIDYLVNRKEPLNTGLKPGNAAAPAPTAAARKVSLGTVPDFAFQGKGYRLSGVVPGSPAEMSGLREGDIIIRLGATEITGLRDLSGVLRQLTPGETVNVGYIRDGKESSVELPVQAK
jgi:hypothetical protein